MTDVARRSTLKAQMMKSGAITPEDAPEVAAAAWFKGKKKKKNRREKCAICDAALMTICVSVLFSAPFLFTFLCCDVGGASFFLAPGEHLHLLAVITSAEV